MKKSDQSVITPLLVLLLIKFLPGILFISASCIGFLIAAALLHFSGYDNLILLACIPAIAFGLFVKDRTKVTSKLDSEPTNKNI